MRLIARLAQAALLCGAAVLVIGGGLSAGEKAKAMIGKKAPAFESVDENGKPWKSSEHVGKKIVVLYFYPADFTGGCTKQACSFRDEMPTLKGEGVEIVGVSGDTPQTHAAFKKYHNLNFTLLADDKGEVASKFGVPHKVGTGKAKGFDIQGNPAEVVRGATISRYTVVIDKNGDIAAVDQISDAGGDAKRVENVVKKLQSK